MYKLEYINVFVTYTAADPMTICRLSILSNLLFVQWSKVSEH